ncbi:uncharacterized protein ARB_04079 [Trichophyton benhamiae CBS 112371]|uniref:Uncharacterized protein n=1 Tax=Arthroderma benhamiae (strain ATCC MYA-4681 / CBS 112371) TaxID=663331 RepID=D4AII4_ARTBC|nr:uncharacterized protein ARB_04079 [Trichophyton benhamiae CBS 112371]EFE36557.1 hypothetical protein ARB_04079 [Trichophyton benhamiae CBS 112371]
MEYGWIPSLLKLGARLVLLLCGWLYANYSVEFHIHAQNRAAAWFCLLSFSSLFFFAYYLIWTEGKGEKGKGEKRKERRPTGGLSAVLVEYFARMSHCFD